MHFDILVPDQGKDTDKVYAFGRRYLDADARAVSASDLTATACRFCHTEFAHENLQQLIERDGFAIIELENCDPALG